MRFTSTLLLLPSIALAQDQQPLADKVKGWFKQAQSYVQSVQSAAPSIPKVEVEDPVDAAASAAEAKLVHHLTLDNWQGILQPTAQSNPDEPEEWMVFINGANKTCYGMCERADKAWKEAVPLLSAQPSGPQLASIDCDAEQILCNSWAVGPPSIYVMLLPHVLPDQTKPQTTIYAVPLNRTTVTAMDINNIHAKEEYKKLTPYEGYFHPFDGLIAQYGLSVPLAHLMWGLAKMPSWLPMVAISLGTRTFMGRRTGRGNQPAPAQGGAAQ
ncbi:hypothetical protein NA57DRAFT_55869 [Rhizodiscina lignyota]|uniref:Peptidyl-tRNA hydrolase n=1 Tax=Rhizodiscina lignyota TaxID=1504668 RepID=A0A9P4IHW1_9PEZI|nr:hypothetical protein NA57DRAFT_55869 [Rhizodiscina lignyota]